MDEKMNRQTLVATINPRENSTILVCDVHASESGALSVLNDFYAQVCAYEDKSIRWIFAVSVPAYQDRENIKTLRYPWVKKSWFHRLYFDLFVTKKIIKKYKPDKVFSLQNMGLPLFKGEQAVYFHLPFVVSDYKFRFWSDEKKLWVYQRIMGKRMFRSLRKVDWVIVQTKWIKEALIKKGKVSADKIRIERPLIPQEGICEFQAKEENFRRFFYPATAFRYKNHRTLLKAVTYAVENGLKEYEILFTLSPKENPYTKQLWQYVQENHLNVKFIGMRSRQEIFETYGRSVLLFPSLLESFGMPLLEAKLTGSPVLAGDCPFCHEILDGYEKVSFFSPMDYKELGTLMLQLVQKSVELK